MKSFQSLFPPLSPETLSLSSARRIVLIQYNPERDTVDFRHYLITVKPYGVSRRVRKVLEGTKVPSKSHSSGLLDLGREQDVADFLLRRKGEAGPGDDGYESAASSASSVAGDDGDNISLTEDYVGRNNKRGQRRAVRLDEIGPRMELRLVKITEGIPGKEGTVMYHSFGMQYFLSFDSPLINFSIVKKSKAETAAQKKVHAEKERLRKERREEQERNVARKKGPTKRKEQGDSDEEDGSDDNDDEDEGEWDDEDEITEGEATEDESQSESDEDEAKSIAPPKKKKKPMK